MRRRNRLYVPSTAAEVVALAENAARIARTPAERNGLIRVALAEHGFTPLDYILARRALRGRGSSGWRDRWTVPGPPTDERGADHGR